MNQKPYHNKQETRPNFFIVGAPRAGTTSMDEYLRQHPEIFVPYVKEAHFFGRDLTKIPHPFFVLQQEDYLKLFRKARDYKAIGETSVMYLYSKTAAQEIKAFSPTAKIIIMLRNPVDMIYSHHSHLYWAGYEPIRDFAQALAAEPLRKQGIQVPPHANLREALFYRDTARYSGQIMRYIKIFGEENVHIVIFDDLKENLPGEYEKILSFLGVRKDFRPKFHIANANKEPRIPWLMPYIQNPPQVIQKLLGLLPHRMALLILQKAAALDTRMTSRPPMPSELRKRLIDEFVPEVERIEKLLKRDLPHWKG